MSEYQQHLKRSGRPYSLGHLCMYTAVAELLRARKASILEVGIGIGCGLERLMAAGAVGKYWGIESQADSMEFARAKFPGDQVEMVWGDWLRVPESEVPVMDYGLCIEVIEHVPALQQVPFLKKLGGHVRKNLFVSTPDKRDDPHGVRTTDEWQAVLLEAGWLSVPVREQWTTWFLCARAESGAGIFQPPNQ